MPCCFKKPDISGFFAEKTASQRKVFLRPVAAADKGVALSDASSDVKQKREAKVSRVFTEHVRGVAEAESAPDDFRRIEAVIADAEIRNHFEVGIKIKFGFGYFEVGCTNKDINAGTEFGRCFGRELITIENFS